MIDMISLSHIKIYKFIYNYNSILKILVVLNFMKIAVNIWIAYISILWENVCKKNNRKLY